MSRILLAAAILAPAAAIAHGDGDAPGHHAADYLWIAGGAAGMAIGIGGALLLRRRK